MLNRSHAQGSPLYNKLQQRLMQSSMGLSPKLATRFDWIVARFIRWCALHAAGGGWMSDYDVVNKGFTPDMADIYEKDNTLYINTNDSAYIFYATKEHCSNAIKKFIQEPIIDEDKVLQEESILGVNSVLHDVMSFIYHAKNSESTSRSGDMKNACE